MVVLASMSRYAGPVIVTLFFAVMSATVSPWYLFGVLWMAALMVLDRYLQAHPRKRHRSQAQHGGPGSHNVQAGRDVNL